MGSLPLPLLSGGHEPLSQSVMQAYPINQYGYANRSVPTQRVKTLIDLLGEKDVWPEQYKKLIPLLPVYHFTAFVPRPIQPEDFVADYSFQVSASRPMIVHRVIQDRLIPGYVYNPADRVSLLSTFELQIDDIAVDEARKASHCLFRAQDSLGLIDASNDGIDSVSGRVVLVVMQQPQPKMEFRAIDPWNTNSPLMRGGPTLGASISGTSIGMGDRLAPVRIGDGASIDPERLPAIISIRVLGVRQTDQISNQLLDVAGSIRQFK
jgi:hypothetical protein